MPEVDSTLVIVLVAAAISAVLLFIYSRGGKKADLARADQFLSQGLEDMRKGEHGGAEFLFNKALDVYASNGNHDVSKESSCLLNLANCYSRQNKFTESRASIARMLDLWTTTMAKNSASIADIDYFAATADFGSGISDVVNFYRKLIDVKREKFGAGSTEVTNGMLLYSRLLAKSGDRREAQRVEAEARAIITPGAARVVQQSAEYADQAVADHRYGEQGSDSRFGGQNADPQFAEQGADAKWAEFGSDSRSAEHTDPQPEEPGPDQQFGEHGGR